MPDDKLTPDSRMALIALLRRSLRTYDLLALYAPPEDSFIVSPEGSLMPPRLAFAIVLLGTPEETAAQIAERICELAQDDPGIHLTLHLGIASLSLDTPNAEMLLAQAGDAARRAERTKHCRVWRQSETRALQDRFANAFGEPQPTEPSTENTGEADASSTTE
jgi:hypothetical protein